MRPRRTVDQSSIPRHTTQQTTVLARSTSDFGAPTIFMNEGTVRRLTSAVSMILSCLELLRVMSDTDQNGRDSQLCGHRHHTKYAVKPDARTGLVISDEIFDNSAQVGHQLRPCTSRSASGRSRCCLESAALLQSWSLSVPCMAALGCKGVEGKE